MKIDNMCRLCDRDVACNGLCRKHYYGQKNNKWKKPECELTEITPYQLPSWEEMLRKRFLYAALEQIGKRESLIIKLHWLENLTLRDIEQFICLSRERIRQIEERAFLRLRRTLIKKEIYPHY